MHSYKTIFNLWLEFSHTPCKGITQLRFHEARSLLYVNRNSVEGEKYDKKSTEHITLYSLDANCCT